MSDVIIYGRDDCPYCDKAKELCWQLLYDFEYLNLDEQENKRDLIAESNLKTVPIIKYKNQYFDYTRFYHYIIHNN